MQNQLPPGAPPGYSGASLAPVAQTPQPIVQGYAMGPSPLSGHVQQSTNPSRLIMGASLPLPTSGIPYVATNSTGHIVPKDQPYAFTSVTYAKQPGIGAIKQEEFKQHYLNQRSERLTQNTRTPHRRVLKSHQNRGCCPCC